MRDSLWPPDCNMFSSAACPTALEVPSSNSGFIYILEMLSGPVDIWSLIGWKDTELDTVQGAFQWLHRTNTVPTRAHLKAVKSPLHLNFSVIFPWRECLTNTRQWENASLSSRATLIFTTFFQLCLFLKKPKNITCTLYNAKICGIKEQGNTPEKYLHYRTWTSHYRGCVCAHWLIPRQAFQFISHWRTHSLCRNKTITCMIKHRHQ